MEPAGADPGSVALAPVVHPVDALEGLCRLRAMQLTEQAARFERAAKLIHGSWDRRIAGALDALGYEAAILTALMLDAVDPVALDELVRLLGQPTQRVIGLLWALRREGLVECVALMSWQVRQSHATAPARRPLGRRA